MRKVNIAIIGGGITGCATAYYLAKEGIESIVFEKNFVGSGATGRCGGGIRQQFDKKENIILAIESVKIFEQLSDELNYDIEYRQGGYLVIAHSEDELNKFKQNVKLQRSLGLDVDVINRDKIHEIAPILDVDSINAIGGTFCSTDGCANPFKTVNAYAVNAKKLGAEIKTYTEIKKIKKDNDKFILITEKENIIADTVVDCGGADAKNIAGMVDVSLPNKPYRHEILATEPMKKILNPMVISFRDGIYFCQHEDGQIVGGIGNPDEKPGINLSSSLWFLRTMGKMLTLYVPALKHINILRQWAGMYDVTPDAAPILGYTNVENFVVVCGFSGHGFMIAPAVAKHISELLITGTIPKQIEHLNLDRFKTGDITEEHAVVG